MERDTDQVFRELTDRLEEEFRRTATDQAVRQQRSMRRRRGTLIGAALASGAMVAGVSNAPVGAALFLGSVLVLNRAWR